MSAAGGQERWTLYVCPECGRSRHDSIYPRPDLLWCDGACTHPAVNLVPVEVIPSRLTEALIAKVARAMGDAPLVEVEAGLRAAGHIEGGDE